MAREEKGTGGGDGKLDATNEFDRGWGEGWPHMGKSLIRVLLVMMEQALVRVSDSIKDGRKDR